MKLHLTATSERGKPVTKSGNEYIQIQLQGEDRVIFGSIHIYPGKYVFGSIHGKKFEMKAEPKTARDKDCEKCGRYISDLEYANNGGRCNDCR